MEINEAMVEQQETETATDDTLQEVLVEDTDESESLESALQEDSEEQEKPQQQPSQSEPGWIRKRVDKAVQKAIADTEARMQANFDKQLAPYRDQLITMEANELVRSGKVKDLETAKELVRYRKGQPQIEAQPEQPRNEKGQFAAMQGDDRDPAIQAQIDMLTHQANRIKERTGVDVIAEFQTNEEVRKKVSSGDWDFYDVAEALAKPKKRPPSPVRSPNGVSGSEKSAIMSMTKEQFKKFDEKISGGARYSVK